MMDCPISPYLWVYSSNLSLESLIWPFSDGGEGLDLITNDYQLRPSSLLVHRLEPIDFRIKKKKKEISKYSVPASTPHAPSPPCHRRCLHQQWQNFNRVFSQLSGEQDAMQGEDACLTALHVPSDVSQVSSLLSHLRADQLLPSPTSQPLAVGHPEVTAVLCPAFSECGNQPERYKVNCFLMTDGAGLENKRKKRLMMLVIPTFFFLLGKCNT